jgi:hypothetical protein
MTTALALASVLPAALWQDPEESVSIEVADGFRNIRATGLPDHPAGPFVYRNETVELRSQGYEFRVPVDPKPQRRATAANRGPFGVALNGVAFDSRPEEYWQNGRSGWSYDPLRNEVRLQLDASHGHADRRGTYHYHGPPTAILARMGRLTDMRLIGWAADGFPIYDQYGYVDPKNPRSGLKVLTPSYWVRPGNRDGGPGGAHDGTFVEDWVYVEGRGDLDECNGRTGVTPEFPKGTYYYVVTERFPGVPRLFRGTPDASFTRRDRGREW